MTQSSEKIQHPVIQSRLYAGQWVSIHTNRPHKDQWNGAVGQIKTITNFDVVYIEVEVASGRHTPCVYAFEVEPLPVPQKQGDAA